MSCSNVMLYKNKGGSACKDKPPKLIFLFAHKLLKKILTSPITKAGKVMHGQLLSKPNPRHLTNPIL